MSICLLRNASFPNLFDRCAISLPLKLTATVSAGISLLGKKYTDASLLAAAGTLRTWKERYTVEISLQPRPAAKGLPHPSSFDSASSAPGSRRDDAAQLEWQGTNPSLAGNGRSGLHSLSP